MKRSNSHRYSGITSYEDFRREKDMLLLRSKIFDTKLSLAFLQIKQNFTPSNLILSLVREFVMPELARFLVDFVQRNKDKAMS